MAIFLKTSDPEALLKDFKKKIDSGAIETWSYDQDGDFTHTPPQWKHKAWLQPKIEGGELVFTILHPKDTKISTLVYALYHGRFIEAMLNHCDSLFTESSASAYPSRGDRIS
jgi:hypothetical protein